MTDATQHDGQARLSLPEGWVVDDLCRARLEQALDGAAPQVVGIAAVRTALPPGSSFRVAGERRALLPAGEATMAGPCEVDGAVLLRSGVEAEVRGGGVAVEGGQLLVDVGATVHDPWRPLGSIDPASPLGRPPFPRRPVVLLLGLAEDPDIADWARRTVNGLVRRSTEGRIAVPAPTGGLHLTSPCAPVAASVEALRPDIVVTLDDGARAVAAEWLGADRSAVVVELTHDTSDAIELVSWRIGSARGRVRARIGRGVGVAPLEDLVRRLCTGPQPLPPSTEDDRGLRIGRRRERDAPRPR